MTSLLASCIAGVITEIKQGVSCVVDEGAGGLSVKAGAKEEYTCTHTQTDRRELVKVKEN